MRNKDAIIRGQVAGHFSPSLFKQLLFAAAVSLSFVAALLTSMPVLAQDQQSPDSLTTIEGHSHECQITEIDEQGQIQCGDLSPQWLDRVLSIERAVELRTARQPAVIVHLAHGGLLRAQSAVLRQERLTLNTEFGKFDLPIEAVRAVIFKPAAATPALTDNIRRPSNQLDTVWAESGEGIQSAEGIVQSINEESLSGEFGGQLRTIATSRLVAYVAADLGLAAEIDSADCVLADHSTLSGAVEKLKEGVLVWRLAGGGKVNLPWEFVVRISIKSDRLVWLSDLSPLENVQEPIVTDPRPTQQDRSVLGNPLSLRRSGRREPVVYAKGLGMHSYARATYANDGGYDRFMATVGIDSQTQGYGDCMMIVKGDNAELWSGRVRAGDDPLEIDVDVSRVRRISLIVEPGAQLDMADHADWCNARLVKTK